jgi:formylglycine-generating enzyme required for sulfatase activity
VSDGFEQVCAKALSLMPSERYPDAEALLCALEAATGGTEPRVGERAERQEKEGRLVAGQQAFAGGSREEGEEGGGARLGGLVETFVPSGAKAGTTTDRSMVEQQLKRGGMGNRRRVLVLGSVAGAVVVVVGVILWSRSEGNGQETTAGREAAAVMTEPPVRPKPGTYVRIEPGTFMMGSPTDERGRQSHETQHKVTLTHAFMMKATEVTQGEWVAVMGSNPSHFSNCGASCPVEKVSWDEAIVYANVVSQKEGLEGCYKDGDKDYDMSSAQGGRTPRWPKGLSCAGYRLPTEAEWEYAARAGTTTAYHTGAITVPAGEDPNLDKAGWYVRNSGSATHPVGEKAANAWGLHDVYGNVSEWVSDWKGENGSGDQTDPVGPRMGVERVFRGGSFRHAPWDCRSASSFSVPPGHRSYSLGFRLSRSIP